jgi:rare lipoprotein A (peptidoglycan hydrolase)
MALAQSFEDRWSIIPKAKAEPSPPAAQERPPAPQEGTQAQQAQPQPDTIGQSVTSTPAATVPEKPRPLAKAAPKKVKTTATTARTVSGKASFISYPGGKTASGALYRPQAFTAAHRTLPFGTRLHVKDVETGKSVRAVVTDRGPFINNRVLDLSRGAAQALGMIERGIIQIRAEVIGPKVQVSAGGV